MKPTTQMLRCFTLPDEEPSEKEKGKENGKEKEQASKDAKISRIERIVREIGAPWFGPMVVFDTETMTGLIRDRPCVLASFRNVASNTRI
jgi:hypothetical protein